MYGKVRKCLYYGMHTNGNRDWQSLIHFFFLIMYQMVMFVYRKSNIKEKFLKSLLSKTTPLELYFI